VIELYLCRIINAIGGTIYLWIYQLVVNAVKTADWLSAITSACGTLIHASRGYYTGSMIAVGSAYCTHDS